MKIKEIVAPLENFAPLVWQEDYDNSGLVVGRGDDEVASALVCVDVTPEVLDEADRLGVRLVISHHPVIFRPVRRFNGHDHTEQTVERALKSGVALYACHTNLDSAPGGMSFRLAGMLGIVDLRILAPSGDLKTGQSATGSPQHTADTPHGVGVIGKLEKPARPIDYLREVRQRLDIEVIRHSRLTEEPISRVALCTGSAAALIPHARNTGAELFMAADFKYNDFFAHGILDPSHPFMVADIGHFESEFCAIDLIYDIISKKIPNFALHKSTGSRNPVGYLAR